jgi:hypothetical protein
VVNYDTAANFKDIKSHRLSIFIVHKIWKRSCLRYPCSHYPLPCCPLIFFPRYHLPSDIRSRYHIACVIIVENWKHWDYFIFYFYSLRLYFLHKRKYIDLVGKIFHWYIENHHRIFINLHVFCQRPSFIPFSNQASTLLKHLRQSYFQKILQRTHEMGLSDIDISRRLPLYKFMEWAISSKDYAKPLTSLEIHTELFLVYKLIRKCLL